MKHVGKGVPFLLLAFLLIPVFYLLLPLSSGSSDSSEIDSLAPVDVIAEGLKEPTGIVVDQSGALFVSDRKSGEVLNIAAGETHPLITHLKRPVGLSFDANGRLLIVEEKSGSLLRLEPDGTLTILAQGMKKPRWVSVGEDGSVYITAKGLKLQGDKENDEDDEEEGDGEIILRLAQGQLSVFVEGFKGLQAIVIREGTLLAAARGLKKEKDEKEGIFKIPVQSDGKAGLITRVTKTGIKKPFGLALDTLSALYVTVEEMEFSKKVKDAIGKVFADGVLSRFASKLEKPRGLAFDTFGNLYVSDDRGDKKGRIIRLRAPPPPALVFTSFTNEIPLTLHGKTEANSRIDAFSNDSANPITVSTQDGSFALTFNLKLNNQNFLDVFTTAYNGQGLTSAPAELTITHDNIAPVIANLQPVSGSFLGTKAPLIAADFIDAGSGVETTKVKIQLDGVDVIPQILTPTGFTLIPSALTEGQHAGSVTVFDRANNFSSASTSFTVDVTVPDTQITSGPLGETGETNATFTFTGADNLTPGGGLQFAWRFDGGTWSAFSPNTSATFSTLSEGSHLFQVKARDLAGNEDTTPAQREFSVVLGPVITAFSPGSGTLGSEVVIEGRGFDPAPGKTFARFNGVQAVISSITQTTIRTTLPIGAITGRITVETPKGTATSAEDCIVLLRQDFALSVSPEVGSAVQGTSTTYAVRITSAGIEPFTGLASLTVSGLPVGATAALTPAALSSNGTGLLTLTTSSSTPVGSHVVEVRATSQLEGRLVTRAATVTLAVQAPGQTVLAGQVRDENERPLSGVSIKQGGNTITELGTTDGGGNFFIPLSVAGPQIFLIDGSTANTPAVTYSTVPVTVDIQPGAVNTLGFIPRLPSQPVAKLAPITPGQAAVLTHPNVPGFTMTIPSGVQIIGWDGQPNNQFSVTVIPIDRSPLPPPPPGVNARQIYLFSFGKVGGGIPTGNIPLDSPNDIGGLPGEKVDLYYFNEAPDGTAPNRWEKYGTATVSSDGARIITDNNPATALPYGFPRFCCGGFLRALLASPAPGGGASGGQSGSGKTDGEPVDTATGFFYLDKTDMVLPGILPIAITRTYRTNLTNAGPFGLGTSWPYDIFLQPPPNGSPDSLILFTPGNRQDLFFHQPDGSFINTTSPPLRGAVVTVAGGIRALRYKDGSLWRFDAAGRLISQADRNGNTVTLTRDNQSRVTAISEPSGRQLTVTYIGTTLRIDSVRDPLGRQIRYGYDGSGLLIAVTDPVGGITRYTYDAANRMVSITDPRNITFLINEYDSAGRVIRQTQADGGVWNFAYTTSGSFISQTTVTDPRGNSTTYRFNSSGFLTSQTDALGQIAAFERQPGTNLVLSTTDPLGRVVRFTYDANGNVTSITDPAGNVRSFEYEPTFNKLTKITDPLGQITRFEYDAKGNLTATVDPIGARTTIAYNSFGQPTSTTDPLGNSTTFTYDDFGNLATIADPLDNRAQRAYDLVSRLIEQTDPRGRSTRFSYDGLNRITQIVDALNNITYFSYDGNGNLLAVTDTRGSSITHTYDAMDRLSTRTDPLGRQETYQYDQNGNLLQAADRKGQVSSYAYDALDRRVRSSFADGTFSEFTYDAAGRLVQARDSQTGLILEDYDVLDRLVRETTSQGVVAYAYDSLGRRIRMDVTGQASVTYSYDVASRLRQVVQGTQGVDLVYDVLGRRTRLTLPNGVSTEYIYDPASRLTELIYRNTVGFLGNLTYQYDPAGNRVATGGSFSRTLLPEPVTLATYDAANRQLQFGEKTLTFDSNGNLISITDGSGTIIYTWDARNRLTAISRPTIAANFGYDPYGRRVEKTVNGQRSQYQYDTVNAITELRDGNRIAYLRGLSVDEVFSTNDGTGIRYATTDTLGSIINLSDRNGYIQADYHHGPFGQTQRIGQDGGNPFQFTGRENDGTGLHYNRVRYYDPILSRFISEDPLRPLAGTDLNLYTYVSNSPLNAVDPFGLYEEDVHHDLTYFLARKAGFAVSAAQRLAASNQGIDDSSGSCPVVCGEEARRDWHFTTQERRAELWQGALDGSTDALGRYLHALQDSYSHEGFGPRVGHARAGKAPDKTYNDPEKANRMARDTYNFLREYLQRITGRPVPDHWERIRDQVDRFNRARTASEKKKILGR